MQQRGKRNVRFGVLLLVALPFVTIGSTKSVQDSLVFDLGLAAPESGQPVTTANVYDALTHSAAARKTASSVSTFSGSTAVCGTPDPIAIETRDVNVPFYTGVTRSEPVLVLPQPTFTNETDGGKLYAYRQGVQLSDVSLSSNMTVHLRMLLDASNYDNKFVGLCGRLIDCAWSSGNNSTVAPSGWALDMNTYKSYGFSWLVFRYGYGKAASFVGASGSDSTYIKLEPSQHGHWFDVVLVFRTDETLQRTYLNLYARVDGKAFSRQCNKGTAFPEGRELWLSDYNSKFGSVLSYNNSNVVIGNTSGNCGKTSWETLSAYKDRAGFRGAVSHVRIYDRPLTKAEVYGILSEANGGETYAGTANGTTDEFACADETPAEAFNPYTMPASQMRGSLTAEHPTLAIDVPSKNSDRGLTKVLSVRPLLDSLGAGSPVVSVAVNGKPLGTMNLARQDQRLFYVKGQFVATNGTGCVRYTLTRTGNLAGTLGIDAVTISGGWGEGEHRAVNASDPTDVWRATSDRVATTTLGHPFATKYMESILWGYHPNGTILMPATTIYFSVPEDVATRCETAYVFGFQYNDRCYPILDVYLNGTKTHRVSNLSWFTPYTNVFAAGTLKSGMNTLVLSNATPYSEVKTTDYYATIHFDYHRFLVKPAKRGLMVYVK